MIEDREREAVRSRVFRVLADTDKADPEDDAFLDALIAAVRGIPTTQENS